MVKGSYYREYEYYYSSGFFFCDPVVIESICYRTTAKQLRNESNTTGWQKKVWTGKFVITSDGCRRRIF